MCATEANAGSDVEYCDADFAVCVLGLRSRFDGLDGERSRGWDRGCGCYLDDGASDFDLTDDFLLDLDGHFDLNFADDFFFDFNRNFDLDLTDDFFFDLDRYFDFDGSNDFAFYFDGHFDFDGSNDFALYGDLNDFLGGAREGCNRN